MERVWSTSRGGFSVRSIFTFVLTVFIAALLWATFGNQTPTHAVADAPLTWKGETILYNGHQYFSAGDAKEGDSVGLPVGTHYYLYTPDVGIGGGQATASQKAFVIYFAPGTDPPTAKTASFVAYDYSSSKVFSHPTDKRSLTATPKGEDFNDISSCTVQGIGWIICPITTFLADGMDHIFDIVKDFLVVQPANTTNPNNSLYIAWDTMRSVANVAFIIVFLIIIYSQLTNVGISNYGLKKLLPRLIIAAILVNLSYLICAIAVDISNVLGYSLQDIFTEIRKSTFNISDDTWKDSAEMGWSAVSAIVLSGGVATAGAIIATGGSAASALYLLLPILLGLILTLLVVLLILAARQAIIVILIVVAPLAFVAYLLPNTEQWFKRWRELFMTMLIFFPAFALVFGGSQLAGGIIIQNAYQNHVISVIGVIFGLAVQIAPLVITPLILKFSGGLLGKIAGMVNDPKKGLLDRTKNWSGDRAAMHKARALSDTKLKRRNVARRFARALDNNNKSVKKRTEIYNAEGDNRFNRTPRYEKLFEKNHEAETEKKRIESTLERNLQTKIANTPHLFEKQLEVANVSDQADKAKLALENALKEAKTGKAPAYGPQTARMTQLINEATAVTKSMAAETARGQSADSATQRMIAQAFNVKLNNDNSNINEFIASKALLNVAGGIQGSEGITRAKANATAALAKMESEALDNSLKLLGAEATLAGSSLKIHTKAIVDEVMLHGNRAGYEASVIEAALEAQAQDGQIGVVEDARGSRFFNQTDVNKVIARNVATMKQKGGFHLQADPDLNIEYFINKFGDNTRATDEFERAMTMNRIASLGDTSASNISELKAGWLESMAGFFANPTAKESAFLDEILSDTTGKYAKQQAALQASQANFDLALRNEQVRATIGDRIPQVQDIRNKLNEKLGPITTNPDAPQGDNKQQNP